MLYPFSPRCAVVTHVTSEYATGPLCTEVIITVHTPLSSKEGERREENEYTWGWPESSFSFLALSGL